MNNLYYIENQFSEYNGIFDKTTGRNFCYCSEENAIIILKAIAEQNCLRIGILPNYTDAKDLAAEIIKHPNLYLVFVDSEIKSILYSKTKKDALKLGNDLIEILSDLIGADHFKDVCDILNEYESDNLFNLDFDIADIKQ